MHHGAGAAANQAVQFLGWDTLQSIASVVRGVSGAVSAVLPWPLQQPVAVLGSDLAGIIGFQPALEGIERLAVCTLCYSIYLSPRHCRSKEQHSMLVGHPHRCFVQQKPGMRSRSRASQGPKMAANAAVHV